MKRIVFVTGSRADFGKLKPLMLAVNSSPDFKCLVFVTGMHVLSRYGLTVNEVYKAGFCDIYTYINQVYGESMEMVLANTIIGLSRYLLEYQPDLIVIHGDRVETLAGAIAGALQNILVAHIEGGEMSGTIDELIRHSVSKMSHIHFVSNKTAADRLLQLGEDSDRIYIIGSPDIDIMLNGALPEMEEVKKHYEIGFSKYAILVYHPVTTELDSQEENVRELATALIASGDNYIVIYPNSDVGSDLIFKAYERFQGNARFRVFPSLRFEYFLSLLKEADYIIGNSSVGIREAPVYAVPAINVGSRQQNRFEADLIINVAHDRKAILEAIAAVKKFPKMPPCYYFGDGHGAAAFMKALAGRELWETPKQKQFCDILR